MIQDSEVSVLLAAIGAADPCERGRAADEVADIHRALGAEQAARVASELVVARLHETVPECQEVQLNALGDLKAWHMIPKQLLLSLAPLQSESLGAQKEYLVPRHRGFDRLNLCRPALALFTDDVYLHLSLRPAPRTCPRGSGASAGLNSQVQVEAAGATARADRRANRSDPLWRGLAPTARRASRLAGNRGLAEQRDVGVGELAR